MGLPMAARLTAAGWSVIAFDQDPARLHQVEELGGVPVGSCAEVAAAADEFVITMVRDGAQTSETCSMDPAGFAPRVCNAPMW